MRRCPTLTVLFLLALGVSVSALAADYDSPPAAGTRNRDMAQARAALSHEDWSGAIDALQKVIAKDDRNADAYNLLGFASRKSGKLDAAFRYYDKALALDPKHRGAYEYQGEAFLMANKPAKAQANLETLARLCNSSCEEYADLKKAIERYKTGKR